MMNSQLRAWFCAHRPSHRRSRPKLAKPGTPAAAAYSSVSEASESSW